MEREEAEREQARRERLIERSQPSGPAVGPDPGEGLRGHVEAHRAPARLPDTALRPDVPLQSLHVSQIAPAPVARQELLVHNAQGAVVDSFPTYAHDQAAAMASNLRGFVSVVQLVADYR